MAVDKYDEIQGKRNLKVIISSKNYLDSLLARDRMI
jgi:hypothetical protein